MAQGGGLPGKSSRLHFRNQDSGGDPFGGNAASGSSGERSGGQDAASPQPMARGSRTARNDGASEGEGEAGPSFRHGPLSRAPGSGEGRSAGTTTSALHERSGEQAGSGSRSGGSRAGGHGSGLGGHSGGRLAGGRFGDPFGSAGGSGGGHGHSGGPGGEGGPGHAGRLASRGSGGGGGGGNGSGEGGGEGGFPGRGGRGRGLPGGFGGDGNGGGNGNGNGDGNGGGSGNGNGDGNGGGSGGGKGGRRGGGGGGGEEAGTGGGRGNGGNGNGGRGSGDGPGGGSGRFAGLGLERGKLRRGREEGREIGRGIWDPGLVGVYYQDPERGQLEPGHPIDWATLGAAGSRKVTTHTCKTIDFDWGTNPPLPGMRGTYWSVRWTGRIFVPKDDDYQFSLGEVDDGGRLFLDGEKIIDVWMVQKSTARAETKHLLKGAHQIRLEYAQGPATASSVRLQWKSSSFPTELVGIYKPGS